MKKITQLIEETAKAEEGLKQIEKIKSLALGEYNDGPARPICVAVGGTSGLEIPVDSPLRMFAEALLNAIHSQYKKDIEQYHEMIEMIESSLEVF